MEKDIQASLIRLLDGIRRTDSQIILEETARLDGFLADGRGVLHPQLVHFLQGRSYPKALAFLGGDPGIPVGNCGGAKHG